MKNLIQEVHVLDVRSIWIKELAAALAKCVKTTGWIPDISWLGHWKSRCVEHKIDDPTVSVVTFPLQRGFSSIQHLPFLDESKRIVDRLAKRSEDPSQTLLLCTTPHYHSIAKLWPGPSYYYMSDLYYAWGAPPESIRLADDRMSKLAEKIFVVSKRCQTYLVRKVGCEPSKILRLPMATRSSNIPASPLTQPDPLPKLIAELPRPIIGIIGNLAANVDWRFLRDSVQQTPDYSWLFIGASDMPIRHSEQNATRQELLHWANTNSRIRFIGPVAYSELQSYARSFDVALLPYRKRESTYSGSSTRYYEHLPAGRPIIATPGFAELLDKPFVQIVRSSMELVDRLNEWKANGFSCKDANAMWESSQNETWEKRAEVMLQDINYAQA